jgi:hypothetical protein
MKLDKYITEHETISMACFINPAHQYYQHRSLSNCCGNNHNLIWMTDHVGYVYHASWAHLNSTLHKSLPSVLPTLQPQMLLRKNLNIAWTPAPSSWILVCILHHLSPSQWLTSQGPLISNTSTAAFQILEVIIFILLEYHSQPSWNLVSTSCHLRQSQRHTSNPFHQYTTILSFKFYCFIDFITNTYWSRFYLSQHSNCSQRKLGG